MSSITAEKYNLIRSKYGHCASWAIWAKQRKGAEDDRGYLTAFDDEKVIYSLKPHIVFIGLNRSRKGEEPFGNFHDPRPRAVDYKLRFSLEESPSWSG